MVLSGHKLSPYSLCWKIRAKYKQYYVPLFSNAYHMKRDIFFSDSNALILSEGTNEIIISIIFDVMNESELDNDASVCH